MISSNILSNQKNTYLFGQNKLLHGFGGVSGLSVYYYGDDLSTMVKGVMVTKNSEKAVQITLLQMVIWYNNLRPLIFATFTKHNRDTVPNIQSIIRV